MDSTRLAAPSQFWILANTVLQHLSPCSASMTPQKASGVFVVLALITRAAAHGGILHDWPNTPAGSNYIRTKIASCSSWVPGKDKPALVDSTAADAGAPVFRGEATVWTYLYGNCSVPAGTPPSAGVEFNVSATRGGKPLSGVSLDGVAMTGTCAAGGQPYYFNLTEEPINDAHNILWFHNYTTNATGRIWGNGANDGYVYTNGSRSIKSLVIRLTATNESLACCDLKIAAAANTDWAATLEGKGQNCDGNDDDDSTPSDSTEVTGHMDHMDHMNHSSMTNMTSRNNNGTVNGTARAASGAGGNFVGLFFAGIAIFASLIIVA